MRAKHLKTWLAGMEREEDPEHGEEGAGNTWKQLVKLVQAIWDTGEVPTPLHWVIVVNYPHMEDHRAGDESTIGCNRTS